MTWLRETPTCVVEACLAAMPRLEAEESIAQANRIAVGTGKVDADERRRMTREWARLANGPLFKRGPRPSADELGQMGIEIRHVPANRSGA